MTTAAVSSPTPVQRYNTTAIVLHWIVAALIIINVVAGLLGENDKNPNLREIVNFHKSIGLTVLGLVALRILWRLANRPPPLPNSYSRAEQRLAHVAHLILYGLILALPLTGYIHDSAWSKAAKNPIIFYGLFQIPRIGFIKNLDPATKEQIHSIFSAAHLWLGYGLYVMFALHLLGVIKHHVFDREPELQRMIPGRSTRA